MPLMRFRTHDFITEWGKEINFYLIGFIGILGASILASVISFEKALYFESWVKCLSLVGVNMSTR